MYIYLQHNLISDTDSYYIKIIHVSFKFKKSESKKINKKLIIKD